MDSLLAEHETSAPAKDAGQTRLRGPFEEEEDPDDDDLDALLAEQPLRGYEIPNESRKNHSDEAPRNEVLDEFADDEEAMASMGDLW